MVPSSDRSSPPPDTNKRAGDRYVFLSNNARDGHRNRTLCKAASPFRLLNAFAASISKMPSVDSSSYIACMACTAALMPEGSPEHFWMKPQASAISGPTTRKIDLATILLSTYPTPIGRTPGFLSSAMRRHAKNGARPSLSTSLVASNRATQAKE